MAPILTAIIEQGIDEGVFSTAYPAETSGIVLAISRSLSETISEMLLDDTYDGDMAAAFERTIYAHEYAIARVLGFDGLLKLIDVETAKLWSRRTPIASAECRLNIAKLCIEREMVAAFSMTAK